MLLIKIVPIIPPKMLIQRLIKLSIIVLFLKKESLAFFKNGSTMTSKAASDSVHHFTLSLRC
jgi:hypothetical protein